MGTCSMRCAPRMCPSPLGQTRTARRWSGMNWARPRACCAKPGTTASCASAAGDGATRPCPERPPPAPIYPPNFLARSGLHKWRRDRGRAAICARSYSTTPAGLTPHATHTTPTWRRAAAHTGGGAAPSRCGCASRAPARAPPPGSALTGAHRADKRPVAGRCKTRPRRPPRPASSSRPGSLRGSHPPASRGAGGCRPPRRQARPARRPAARAARAGRARAAAGKSRWSPVRS